MGTERVIQKGLVCVLHKDDSNRQVWYWSNNKQRELPDAIVFEVPWPPEQMVFWYQEELYQTPPPGLE